MAHRPHAAPRPPCRLRPRDRGVLPGGRAGPRPGGRHADHGRPAGHHLPVARPGPDARYRRRAARDRRRHRALGTGAGSVPADRRPGRPQPGTARGHPHPDRRHQDGDRGTPAPARRPGLAAPCPARFPRAGAGRRTGAGGGAPAARRADRPHPRGRGPAQGDRPADRTGRPVGRADRRRPGRRAARAAVHPVPHPAAPGGLRDRAARRSGRAGPDHLGAAGRSEPGAGAQPVGRAVADHGDAHRRRGLAGGPVLAGAALRAPWRARLLFPPGAGGHRRRRLPRVGAGGGDRRPGLRDGTACGRLRAGRHRPGLGPGGAGPLPAAHRADPCRPGAAQHALAPAQHPGRVGLGDLAALADPADDPACRPVPDRGGAEPEHLAGAALRFRAGVQRADCHQPAGAAAPRLLGAAGPGGRWRGRLGRRPHRRGSRHRDPLDADPGRRVRRRLRPGRLQRGGDLAAVEADRRQLPGAGPGHGPRARARSHRDHRRPDDPRPSLDPAHDRRRRRGDHPHAVLAQHPDRLGHLRRCAARASP